MEFKGIDVGLDVATGLGLLGALLGWLLRKWHEDKMAVKIAQHQDDAFVIKSLEPLNEAIQGLYFELRKEPGNMDLIMRRFAEVENFYTHMTISAAAISSSEIYDVLFKGVEGHRQAVEKRNINLVALNGIVLFCNLLERLRGRSFADKAIRVLYGSSIEEVKNKQEEALAAE